MKIRNTNDVTAHKAKILIYGEPKAGKTSLAATLDGKTLVISGEEGLNVLNGYGIDYESITRNDDDSVIQDAQKRLSKLEEIFKFLHAGTAYKNIFLDSLSEIGELVLSNLQKIYPDAKDSRTLWGEYFKKMHSIVKNFRDLNYNVYITCAASIEKDEIGKRYYDFMLNGQIAEKLPYYFDVVVFAQCLEGKHSLICDKRDKYRTGSRVPRNVKLDAIEPADLGALTKKLLVPKPEEKPKT